MKVLDRFNLELFSGIILIISVVLCLFTFGWIEINDATNVLNFIATNEIANKVTLGVSIVLILLAMKSIFFNSYAKEKIEGKDGILLENENGKLLVTKDTLEILTNAVVKSFESAETVTTRVEVDEESQVRIYLTLFVKPDAAIKELSSKLQSNIKETIMNSLGLEVKEVNIRVKNISVKKEPNIKE